MKPPSVVDTKALLSSVESLFGHEQQPAGIGLRSGRGACTTVIQRNGASAGNDDDCDWMVDDAAACVFD